jgi:hypothetical protein
MTNQKSFVHFFCLIKRNEPKKNQVRLKASTCGRHSKKQPNARSPNASLFVHYAAKRTNKNIVQNNKRMCVWLGKTGGAFRFPY